jgi:MFS family permease
MCDSEKIPPSLRIPNTPNLERKLSFRALAAWIMLGHLGRLNCSLVCILLTIISVSAIWFPFGGQTASIVVFVVVFGFASGSDISLTPVYVGQLRKTRGYGQYYATCYTIVSFGCLTGVQIAGEIIERCGGEYLGWIVLTGGYYVGAPAAFAVARARMKGLVC